VPNAARFVDRSPDFMTAHGVDAAPAKDLCEPFRDFRARPAE